MVAPLRLYPHTKKASLRRQAVFIRSVANPRAILKRYTVIKCFDSDEVIPVPRGNDKENKGEVNEMHDIEKMIQEIPALLAPP